MTGQNFRNSQGRQGLRAHDNTHHALYMAYCAVACLQENRGFDRQRWPAFRRVFETHVVDDSAERANPASPPRISRRRTLHEAPVNPRPP